MKKGVEERIQAAVESVRTQSRNSPPVGIVLGSGLSDLASRFGGDEIPYRNIASLPTPTVAGHRGTLTVGADVAVMAGRFHLYEGHPVDDVVLPIFVLHGIGVRTLIITNAAGGINAKFSPGDLVLIGDHMNLMGVNPLFGPNPQAFGPRFPDMSTAYSVRLQEAADRVEGAEMPRGVYAALTGPSYETPAEVRMLRTLGADMVGMSTVPEVIIARYLGMQVLGISCITNIAAGLSKGELRHEEVVETGKRVEQRLGSLLKQICDELSRGK